MVQAASQLIERATPEGSDPLFTLVETIEDLSLARTVEQVAGVIRSAARRITGADGVAFVLRDGDQCWYLDEDAIGPLWKGLRFPMTACISGWAMLNQQTAVIPDIYADARIPHDAYRPTFVKSLVMTPVRPRDPIAAIGAYWSVERQPTDEEIVKLQVMARAAAGALENAQMYAALTETLERRKFLLRELDHRCKNTLAAVQSIADQTLRRAVSPESFVETFKGRLAALSRVHELLTRGEWGRAGLEEVLRQALAPFTDLDGGRVAMQGPALTMSPETAVGLHMTIHELAVNAAKHGALSREGGKVEVVWEVAMDAADRELALNWRETGGPTVSAPTRTGFGMRLIEGGLARDLGGEGRLSFEPQGVRFSLRVPLSNRVALA